MSNQTVTLPISDVVFRDDLYPRIEPDPQTIQRYAEDVDVLPPIEVNQHNWLIDGYHRLTAYQTAKRETITATVTPTTTEREFLRLAIERNAKHGLQLADRDKRQMAILLYGGGTGDEKSAIAKTLSVSERMVSTYLSDVEAQLRKQRNEAMRDLWMACYTDAEIAAAVGLSRPAITSATGEMSDLEALPKLTKLRAEYNDEEWEPPLYDIWNQSRNNNGVHHFGNTPVEFVDNLLYLYTKPFDIVVDPFGGGGSTIDVCKRRSRRYWVSDRKPIPSRKDIRQHDLTDGVSGPARWADVALVYMDPPYWKQAEGQYSDDPTDLANMSLEQFTSTMVATIHEYGAKLHPGAHVAVIISPTQWPNEDKSTVYHDLDFARLVGRKLRLVQRVLCPYSSQQYNGTQVNIAKDRRLLMALTRTMLIWERVA